MSPSTPQEITGIFQHELYRDGAFVIARVRPTDGIAGTQPLAVKGDVEQDDFHIGLEYRFYGGEHTDERGRTAFRFTHVILSEPHERGGVIRYLQQAPGIGVATAQALWDKFKSRAVRIVRETPDVAAAAVGRHFTPAKAEAAAVELRRMAALEATTIDLMGLLDGRGFPKATAKELVRRFGCRAAWVLQRNPYILTLGGFPGCGFLRPDAMYLDLGHPPGRLKRQALCAWHTLHSDRNGHTWYPAETIEAGLRANIGGAAINPPAACLLARRAGLLASRWDAEGKLWFAEAKKARQEAYCAEKVSEAAQEAHEWPAVVGTEADDGLPSIHQAAEYAKATAGGAVAILCGSPGTGKTYTVAHAIKVILDTYGQLQIGVCAPTGKAAVRMGELMATQGITLPARTIHSMLSVESVNGGNWVFRHNEFNPLPYRLIVCDECFAPGTMIDTGLGKVTIESIRLGDSILNAAGIDKVVAVKKREVERVVLTHFGKKKVFCSENHRFLTRRGYVFAANLRPGDSFVSSTEAMRLLRERDNTKNEKVVANSVLQRVLQHELVDAISGVQSKSLYQGTSQESRGWQEEVFALRMPRSRTANTENSRIESNGKARSPSEDFRNFEKNWTSSKNTRWQWTTDATTIATPEDPEGQLGDRTFNSHQDAQGVRLSGFLQSGSWKLDVEDCNRAGRNVTQETEKKSGRPEENGPSEIFRVESIEILEPDDSRLDQFRDAEGKLYFYDLQAERHPSFSVEGVLVHNCSMLGTGLFAHLLAARAKGCKLLLVGDANQLAPVEHGAPLRDLIAAGLPYGELREIRRNAGSIVRVCADIRDGKEWQPDDQLDLNVEEPRNLKLIPVHGGEQAVRRIVEILRRIRDAKLADPVWDCQVIVAVNRKSPLSRRKVNEVLQAELNPYPAVDDTPFRLNDKVVQLKNGLLLNAKTGGDEPEKHLVCNGEQGRVVELDVKRIVVQFSNPDRLVRVYRAAKKQADDEADGDDVDDRGCDLDLAYAISCHKSQGSEWPVVIVALDEYPGARMVCDRSWLYTAISRAKQVCFLVGKLGTAYGMCRRVALGKRKTFLRELIATNFS